MKKIIIISIVLISMSAVAKGQTFEEYKKQQEQQYADFKSKSEVEVAKLVNNYRDFVAKQNKEFGDYLEKEWKSYRSFVGIEPTTEPKPKETPVCKRPDTQIEMEKIETLGVLPINSEQLQANDLEPRPSCVSDELVTGKKITLDFYDQKIDLLVNPNLFLERISKIDEKNIKKYWDLISAEKNDYAFLINQLNDYKFKFNLNDWGYFMLVKNSSIRLAGSDENTSRIMTWAILNLSGYKCRIAYSGDKCYLSLPTLQTLYGISYLSFNDLNYYLFGYTGTKVFTYNKEYKGAKKNTGFKPLPAT